MSDDFKRITKNEYEIIKRAISPLGFRKVAGYDVGGRIYRGFSAVEFGTYGPKNDSTAVTLLHSRTPTDEVTWEEGEEVFAVRIGGNNVAAAVQDAIDGAEGFGLSRDAMEAAAAAKPTIVDPVTFVASPAEPLALGDYDAVATMGGVPYGALSGDQEIGYRAMNESYYDLFGAFELGEGTVNEARFSVGKGSSGSGGDFYLWLGRGDLAGASDPVADIDWVSTDTLWTLDGSAGFADRMISPDVAAQINAILPLGAEERLIAALTARGTAGPTAQTNIYLDDPHHPFTLTLA